MGRPVSWAYELRLEPAGDVTRAVLYRLQQGTDTRFRWESVELPRLIDLPGVDDVLSAFYTGCLALMEATV